MPENDNNLIDDQANNAVIESVVDSSTASIVTPLRFAKFITFIKKHKIVLIIAIIMLTILTLVYVFTPVIGFTKLKLVNTNTVVRLELNQTARLKVNNVSAKIVHLTNDVCPAGHTCFGSGQKAVEYQLTVNGQKYATGSQNPTIGVGYKIETISSDYKTYAEIKIIKFGK